jgi:hypothetical protein
VSFLASDALEGRGTPSRGLDIAAEFIAAQFRRAGLDPAGDDGYFQTAPFVSVTPNTDGLELTLETGGQSIRAERGSISLQEAAPVALDQAPVVAVTVSNAAALGGLTAQQVKGKALLLAIPAGTPSSVIRGIPAATGRLGPAVVIMVRANGPAPSPNARVRDASAPASRIPILTVSDPAIRKAVSTGAPVTVSVHVPAPVTAPVKVRNVVGVLRGSDAALKDTDVVVSAHYDHLGVRGSGPGDHIYNGANDDASGTASVIEIANALAALPRPKRSIVFVAFFGEELGELGSQYYVRHPVFPLSRTVADINLEQLGRTDDSQGPHVGMFNLTGFDFTDIAGVLAKAAAEARIRVVNDQADSGEYFSASDNYAFSVAGVPSTTLSVSYVFPDYHRSGDEWPKLDYENMAKVDRAIALGIETMANSAVEPKWNAANPEVEKFMKARGVSR